MPKNSNHAHQPISVVVIGINVATTIADCLLSIQQSDYPQEKLEIIYVDGGSNDRSVELASRFSQVKIIQLEALNPSPGRGRNKGWQMAKHDIIQFLDGDTILDKNWLFQAQSYLKENVVAVRGKTTERYPNKNFFHLIANIEWETTPGFCDAFAGNVLIKKNALEMVQGYDEELIACEDPELSYRLRKKGWKILSLPNEMTQHDIQMSSFKSYLKRASRTGYGYAKVAWRHHKEPEKFRIRELVRIPLGIVLPWTLFLTGILTGYPVAGAIMGLALAFRAVRKVRYYSHRHNIPLYQAFVYTLHLAFVIYPQAIGVFRFFLEWNKTRAFTLRRR